MFEELNPAQLSVPSSTASGSAFYQARRPSSVFQTGNAPSEDNDMPDLMEDQDSDNDDEKKARQN